MSDVSSQQCSSSCSVLPYMRQLDGLRAIAVLLVLLQHWTSITSVTGFVPGRYGVRLFFVLSGFLITGILLKVRPAESQSITTSLHVIRQFYLRRVLRIFPLYYMVFLLLCIFSYAAVRDHLLWFAGYLTNMRIGLLGSGVILGDTFPAPHFWSLAVEEQFYLFWPWLIIFVPRRYLLHAIISFVCIGPLYRGLGLWCGMDVLAIRWNTPGCMDGLAMGAVLAWVVWRGKHSPVTQSQLTRFCLRLGLPLLVITMFLDPSDTQLSRYPGLIVFTDLAIALTATWIVAMTAAGRSGWIGKILENRVMVYLGKISYGIYVIHYFVPHIISNFGYPQQSNALLDLLCWTSVTLLLACLSWRLLENPVNGLKRHFRYSDAQPAKLIGRPSTL